MSTWILVDVEADGPCPGTDQYSMVSFGAVLLDEKLDKTFYGQTAPISDYWIADALAVSGFTREQHEEFEDPEVVMWNFEDWINKVTDFGHHRPVFVSDNPAFDWQFINHYFHRYLKRNPFGFSARRIGDIYSGLLRDVHKSNEWKRLRKTKHTHNPVDDARGNAEALLQIRNKYKLNIPV